MIIYHWLLTTKKINFEICNVFYNKVILERHIFNFDST